MDKIQVEVISQTVNPQQVIYAAMHQDYSSDFVIVNRNKWFSEQRCGEIIVKRLLKGDRGHWGCLEHASIVFNCGYVPHCVVQQITRHRLLSFDVQSYRYSSQHILGASTGDIGIEDVFYLRPIRKKLLTARWNCIC